MRTPLPLLAALVLLSACATANSDRVACPPVQPYPRELQTRADAELAALPPGAVLARLIEDYSALRAWIRAACPERTR